MKDLVYYTMLFDIYGNLLTDKQQKYFTDYYFNNLSLGEIAENYNVSRNAIHNQLKDVKELLVHYETKLSLAKKQELLEEVYEILEDNYAKKKIKEILDM